MQIKKLSLIACVLAVLATASLAYADEDYQGFKAGDIMVRGRALAVVPSVSNGTISGIGGHVDASNSAIPEIDGTYFFTPNIGVEAIAAVTRHHLVDRGSAAGNVDLGRVTLLPPTVTAQYHFLPAEVVNPYVGAGVNYTFFFDHEVPNGGAVTQIHYDNGFGAALQAGADFHLQGNWYANVDVKHIFLTTHAKINSGVIGGDVSIDPTIVGAGIGYKF